QRCQRLHAVDRLLDPEATRCSATEESTDSFASVVALDQSGEERAGELRVSDAYAFARNNARAIRGVLRDVIDNDRAIAGMREWHADELELREPASREPVAYQVHGFVSCLVAVDAEVSRRDEF